MKVIKSRRNMYVLIGLSVWFALATSFFAWFGVQAYRYRDHVKTYNAQVKQILADANSGFKHAHDDANPAVIHDMLIALASNLEAKRNLLPAAPGVFGLQMGADDVYNKQSRLGTAIAIYAADLRATAEYIDYQQKTAVDLQLLSLKSAGNAEQIATLATAWADTITTVTNRVSPTQLKEVSATLLQRLGDAKDIIGQLGDLFKMNDEAGFKVKHAELEATIAALKPIGDQIAAVAVKIDAQLAKDAVNIAKNL